MTIEQLPYPYFNEQVNTLIRTDENYTMTNQDKVVDVFNGPPRGVTIKLPPNPVPGQTHRVLAPIVNVTVDGNGHTIQNLLSNVQIGTQAEYTFSSAVGFTDGVWVACCARSID